MNPKWQSKFQLKSGKWVFVPTPQSVALGRKIKRSIEQKWTAPNYYYHLRSGGHVEALHSHLNHSVFFHIDIQNFFGSINKTRVTRSLKRHFAYEQAREWAKESTVTDPTSKSNKHSIIPYGFVQSQLIASLCLFESALGKCLDRVSKNTNAAVSVYVDDIIVSSCDNALCALIFEELKNASTRANFCLNSKKQESPSVSITAFNIDLKNQSLRINDTRMTLFAEALSNSTSEHQKNGIRNYIGSVNAEQLNGLPQ
jgi:hypothetical protein